MARCLSDGLPIVFSPNLTLEGGQHSYIEKQTTLFKISFNYLLRQILKKKHFALR